MFRDDKKVKNQFFHVRKYAQNIKTYKNIKTSTIALIDFFNCWGKNTSFRWQLCTQVKPKPV